MPVICELRPRVDANPDELKRLEAALKAFADRELGKGILCAIDGNGLASLLGGEPPNPMGTQVAEHNKDVDWARIRQDLGPIVSDRSLRFSVKDEPAYARAQIVETLRQAIPADLVEDFLIDGVSWNE